MVAPVVRIVGAGQRGTNNTAAKSHGIKLAAYGPEAGLEVTQAIGQLREDHRQVLIPTGETTWSRVAAVTGNAFLKFILWQMLDALREEGAAPIHALLLRGSEYLCRDESGSSTSSNSRNEWLHHADRHDVI